jgi:protocatechuate 3,4-dioxygenase beta subunit
MDSKRRHLLLALAGALVAANSASARALLATPRQSAGPFYPVELPLDDDNDLTRVADRASSAKGRISDLSGSIVDINGNPVQGARIEIWQCDANGRYRHPLETGRQARDENFQGHGHTLTDARGQYRFRTIRPVPYPGRTPHIHIAVVTDAETDFVTQMYVKDEPRNRDDFLFRRVPEDRRHMVLAEFRASERPDAELEAQFDIVLAGSAGTPRQG